MVCTINQRGGGVLLQIVNAAESLRPETSLVPENQLTFDAALQSIWREHYRPKDDSDRQWRCYYTWKNLVSFLITPVTQYKCKEEVR